MRRGYLVEVHFAGCEFLFVLLFHYLEVEAQETLNSRRVVHLQVPHTVVKTFEGFQKPLVEGLPLRGEVILDEVGYDERELVVGVLSEDNVVRVLNQLQQLVFDLRSQLVRQHCRTFACTSPWCHKSDHLHSSGPCFSLLLLSA